MMTGKKKVYFLLNRIEDKIVLTPKGQPILIHPANDLNNNYSIVELSQLFAKLEKDEQILKVLKESARGLSASLDPYEDFEDGLHPNTSGHEKIFGQVRDFLTEKKWI